MAIIGNIPYFQTNPDDFRCSDLPIKGPSAMFGGPELQQGFDMQRWHLIFISFDIPKQIPGLNGFNIISWDFMGFDIPQKKTSTRLSRNSPQDYVQHRSSLVGVVFRTSESLRQPQGKDLKMMNSSPELDCPKAQDVTKNSHRKERSVRMVFFECFW